MDKYFAQISMLPQKCYMLVSFYSELINMAVPETIDPRAINKAKNGKVSIFKKHENLTLAINSAKVITHKTHPHAQNKSRYLIDI